MNKIIVIIGMTLILLTISLSGCEEEFGSDFKDIFDEASTEIIVLVAAYANVYGLENKTVTVRFDISKTGGDSFTQYRDVYAPGPDEPKRRITSPTAVSYHLHEGEEIHIEIRLSDALGGSPYSSWIAWSNARHCPKSPSDEDVYVWTPFMSWSFYD